VGVGDEGFLIEQPLFHTTHVVADLFGAADRYVKLFDRALVYAGLHEGARRYGCFVTVGDVWIELLAPDERPGPVRRFAERYGDHLHGLAFYVRHIDELAAVLRRNAVRVSDVTGRPVESEVRRHGPSVHPRFGPTTPSEGGAECEPDWWAAAIFTHMSDACGLFEFCETKAHYNRLDPRGVPGWVLAPLKNDPLGVRRGSHHTVVVESVDAAASLWVGSVGCALVSRGFNPALGTSSALIQFGADPGTLVEFAQPVTDGPARNDLARSASDILHSVSFLVEDLDRVRRHLAAVRCPIETDTETLVVTSPEWCAGARYGFTDVDATRLLTSGT
jgi:hypothetical protein